MPRSLLERLWASVADRGRALIRLPEARNPIERARGLAKALLSEGGEASGAALARELLGCYRGLTPEQRGEFHQFLAGNFLPEPQGLRLAAEAYLADPSGVTAAALADAAEPPRQELLRRLNAAPGATAELIRMRQEVLAQRKTDPALLLLDADLKHLFTSWFNRGFLELQRISWDTSAAVLEKLIAYEAVHEIGGWDELRRRLAPDRRCFAFFHPALPGEPLIFVEVALVGGMAASVQPLLAATTGIEDPLQADTAIFYSINNCQDGLRGISFGNFLIKQVVEELRHELPGLTTFATLSPVPRFRTWLDGRIAGGSRNLLRPEERVAIVERAGRRGAKGAFRALLEEQGWTEDVDGAAPLRAPLLRLAAEFLTTSRDGKGPADPVARFHLGNGARLERINWLANRSPRGLAESYGIMVNYLYDPDLIEANHEAFVRDGTVAYSEAVAALLADRPLAKRMVLGTSIRRGRKNAS